MIPGNLDMICLVKHDQIEYCIDYIRAHVGEDSGKWESFWKYFRKVWVNTYGVQVWNISHLVESDLVIRNRTNNALERFNRTIKQKLGMHPSLAKYVDGIKEISNDYVQRINDVREGRERQPQHLETRLGGIPDNFESWVYEEEGYMWVLRDEDAKMFADEESDNDLDDGDSTDEEYKE